MEATMNCSNARSLLSARVDGELPPEDGAALETHLRDCEQCRAQLAALQSVRTLVAAQATRHRAPADLADRIVDALDDAAPGRKVRASPFWRGAGIGAASATVAAFALGVGLFVAQPSVDDRLADEVVANHVRSLLGGHVVDVVSSDQHTVKPWFNGKLNYAAPVLDFTAEGFSLEGGRLDYLDGRPVAALVYRHRLHTINVFAFPARDGVRLGTPHAITRRGFAIENWTQGGMDFWAVSDVDASALVQLASLYRAQADTR
jgi:anti-sigma factor (TIGR02949 family)